MLAALLFVALVPASVGLRRGPLRAALLVASSANTARLSVFVREIPGGRVLPRATVRVFRAEGERYFLSAEAESDASGQVALAVAPGPAWVLVEAPGRARKSIAVLLEGGSRRVDIALAAGHPLSVRIEDEEKRPIPGATVLVTGADPLPFGAVTDAGGKADLRRLGDAPWKVQVFARGYDAEVRSDVRADATVTLRRSSGLDVRVVDAAGRGAPGAEVLVAGASLWPARRVPTDKDGRARIAGLATGAYDLKATLGALVSKTEVGVRLERGELRALSLVLVPGRMVPIVVTDGEGDHPVVVPNADVVLVEGGVSSFPMQGRTNTFGKVTLGPIAPGAAIAAARADGFVARAGVAVPEALPAELTIALSRGAVLRGEVVDRQGRPIDGATVEVIGTDADGMPIAETPVALGFQRAHFEWALAGPAPLEAAGELGVMSGPIPPIPDPGASSLVSDRMVLSADPAEPWVTRLDGTFRATPVPAGRVRALVRHPAFVETTSEMVTLAAGSEASVRVVLSSGGAVQGTVLDDTGAPVAGARIEVLAVQGTLSRATTSGDDGTFAFSALPGDVFLSLARPDDPLRVVSRRRLEVPEGEKVEVALTLPAPRKEVRVTAVDDSGRPVEMVQITALSLDPEVPLRQTEWSDAAGLATIRDAAGLPLSLVVEAPGYARYTREFSAVPEDVEVALVRGVPVEGHVTSVRGRRDVEGATVELLAGGHRRAAFTDALGVYRFSDVSPGPVHLTVSHPDYAVVEVDAVVESTGRADRAFDLEAIDLEEPGTVEGRVVDGAGNPAAGARVAVGIVSAYLPVGAAPARSATTTSDGTFRLERVRPGTVEIQGYAADVGRGKVRDVVVDPGRTTGGVTLTLERTADEPEPAATGGVAVTLAERRGAALEVVIAEVAPGSEAEHAGLLPGDVLAAVDRKPPSSIEDARRKLAGPDGSDVVLQIVRQGTPSSLRVRRERVRR